MKPRLYLLPLALSCAGALLLWPSLAPAGPPPPPATPEEAKPRHAVVISTPHTPQVLARTKAGVEVSVQCAVCHSNRAPNPGNRAEDLDMFHQGLSFAHGDLGCLACHDANDYDQLHLADGKAIPYRDTLTLCGQCHGPQLRDYEHGAHGGMRGHWDLTAGGRTRNHCVDCHDPHAPAYPKVRPVFPPLKDNH